MLVGELREAASATNGIEELKILLLALPLEKQQRLQKFFRELYKC
jgi:hypothetical protein